MTLKNKNSSFQSCRFCNIGGSLYRVDSDEGTFYVCEDHRRGKDFLEKLSIIGIEEEFVKRPGVIAKAIKYIRGA